MGEAFRKIKDGYLDLWHCAGGSEAHHLASLPWRGFDNMGALTFSEPTATGLSIPFDKERSGFVMGEGAGMLHSGGVRARQGPGRQNLLAEMVGYGATGDAYHITSPDPEGTGAAKAMDRSPCGEAGIAPEDVGYINAHGTSTPLNEKYETSGDQDGLWGARGYRCPSPPPSR